MAMKACVVTKAGGPDVLRMVDRSEPAPDAGEAVVSLVAANVNPTDLGAREGMVPPGFGIEGPPYVLGWDLAGEVAAVGDGVTGVKVGDRVVGMIPWYHAGGRYGAYAERVLLQAEWLVGLPAGLDPVQAATVPLNALTAQQALGYLGAPDGSELLVTGASGAVGSYAVQLAAARGLRVTAVAGTDDEDWVASLGAERVLARDSDLSEIGTFPYVLDAVPVGAAVFPAVADGGTIVSTRPIQEGGGARHQSGADAGRAGPRGAGEAGPGRGRRTPAHARGRDRCAGAGGRGSPHVRAARPPRQDRPHSLTRTENAERTAGPLGPGGASAATCAGDEPVP
jgi:NADPH:quinone reductase-like Zn-dependent oxidoreductase